MGLEERGRMIAVIRRLCDEHAEELGRDGAGGDRSAASTTRSRSCRSMQHVLGVEVMRSEARSDADRACA